MTHTTPAHAPRKQSPAPFRLLPDPDADLSAPAAPIPEPEADHLALVTTPGALVITPSGRTARVIRVIDPDATPLRIEVEYLETDPVVQTPIMLRDYPEA